MHSGARAPAVPRGIPDGDVVVWFREAHAGGLPFVGPQGGNAAPTRAPRSAVEVAAAGATSGRSPFSKYVSALRERGQRRAEVHRSPALGTSGVEGARRRDGQTRASRQQRLRPHTAHVGRRRDGRRRTAETNAPISSDTTESERASPVGTGVSAAAAAGHRRRQSLGTGRVGLNRARADSADGAGKGPTSMPTSFSRTARPIRYRARRDVVERGQFVSSSAGPHAAAGITGASARQGYGAPPYRTADSDALASDGAARSGAGRVVSDSRPHPATTGRPAAWQAREAEHLPASRADGRTTSTVPDRPLMRPRSAGRMPTREEHARAAEALRLSRGQGTVTSAREAQAARAAQGQAGRRILAEAIRGAPQEPAPSGHPSRTVSLPGVHPDQATGSIVVDSGSVPTSPLETTDTAANEALGSAGSRQRHSARQERVEPPDARGSPVDAAGARSSSDVETSPAEQVGQVGNIFSEWHKRREEHDKRKDAVIADTEELGNSLRPLTAGEASVAVMRSPHGPPSPGSLAAAASGRFTQPRGPPPGVGKRQVTPKSLVGSGSDPTLSSAASHSVVSRSSEAPRDSSGSNRGRDSAVGSAAASDASKVPQNMPETNHDTEEKDASSLQLPAAPTEASVDSRETARTLSPATDGRAKAAAAAIAAARESTAGSALEVPMLIEEIAACEESMSAHLDKMRKALRGSRVKQIRRLDGLTLVRDLLVLLLCSRRGLDREEIGDVLGVLEGQDAIPSDVVTVLLSVLFNIITESEVIIALRTDHASEHAVADAVRRRYIMLRGPEQATAGRLLRVRAYRALAHYCRSMADPTGDHTWEGVRQDVFLDLIHYQSRGLDLPGMHDTVLDIGFIEACAHRGEEFLREVVGEMRAAKQELKSTPPRVLAEACEGVQRSVEVHRLRDMASLVGGRLNTLAQLPCIAFQVALDQPSTSAAHEIAVEAMERAVDALKLVIEDGMRDAHGTAANALTTVPRWWFERARPASAEASPGHAGESRIACVTDVRSVVPVPVLCMSMPLNGAFAALGLADGNIELYNLAESKCRDASTSAGHGSAITCIDVSPDSKRIASGARNATVMVWDVDTRSAVTSILGHLRELTAVKWLASRRGGGRRGMHASARRMLATASLDYSVTVWIQQSETDDSDSSKEEHGDEGHVVMGLEQYSAAWNADFLPSAVTCLDFDAVSRFLIATHMNGSVSVWVDDRDASEFALSEHSKFEIAHSGAALAVALSPGEGKAFCGAQDGHVFVFELAPHSKSGSDPYWVEVATSRRAHRQSVLSTAVSKNGRIGLSSSADRSIGVWDVQSLGLLGVAAGHKDQIPAVAFTTNAGDTILSASRDQSVRVWDLREVVHDSGAAPSSSPTAPVSTVRYARKMATKGVAVTFEARRPREPISTQGRHASPVTVVSMCHQSAMGASGAEDGEVKVWDLRTGSELMSLLGHTSGICALEFSLDGAFLFSADGVGVVLVWDCSSFNHVGSVLATESTPSELIGVRALASAVVPNPDGDGQSLVLFCGDASGRVSAWCNLHSNEYATPWHSQPEPTLSQPVLALRLVYPRESGPVVSYSVDDAGQLVEHREEASCRPPRAEWSGERLLDVPNATGTGRAHEFDRRYARTLDPVAANDIAPAKVDINASHLLCMDTSGYVVVWRVETLAKLHHGPSTGSEAGIDCAALSGDGLRVALAPQDAQLDATFAARPLASVGSVDRPLDAVPACLTHRLRYQPPVGIRAWGRVLRPGAPPRSRRRSDTEGASVEGTASETVSRESRDVPQCAALAFSWDGSLVGSASTDGAVCVMESARPHLGALATLAVDADVTSVVIGPGLDPDSWPAGLVAGSAASGQVGAGDGRIGMLLVGDSSGRVHMTSLVDAVRRAESTAGAARPEEPDLDEEQEAALEAAAQAAAAADASRARRASQAHIPAAMYNDVRLPRAEWVEFEIPASAPATRAAEDGGSGAVVEHSWRARVLRAHRTLKPHLNADVSVAKKLLVGLGFEFDDKPFTRRIEQVLTLDGDDTDSDAAPREEATDSPKEEVNDASKPVMVSIGGKLKPMSTHLLPKSSPKRKPRLRRRSLVDMIQGTLSDANAGASTVQRALAKQTPTGRKAAAYARRIAQQRDMTAPTRNAPSSVTVVAGSIDGLPDVLLTGVKFLLGAVATEACRSGGIVMSPACGNDIAAQLSESAAALNAHDVQLRCLGVAAESYFPPGNAAELVPASSHSLSPMTDVLLTPTGSEGACETTMALAVAWRRHVPVVMVVAGGGKQTKNDAYAAVLADIPIVVLSGSGGAADEIVAALRKSRASVPVSPSAARGGAGAGAGDSDADGGDAAGSAGGEVSPEKGAKDAAAPSRWALSVADDTLRRIVRLGKLHVFDTASPWEALPRLLTDTLEEARTALHARAARESAATKMSAMSAFGSLKAVKQ